jgi:peptide/nickel transport system permease protein
VGVILRLLGQRILSLVPLVLGVILLVFCLMQLSGTDPALAAFEGTNASQAQIDAYRHDHGLDDALPLRYVHFVWALLHGDLGKSVLNQRPVLDSVTTALPLTFQLTLLALVLALVLAVALGLLAAVYRDRWPDHLVRVITLAGVAAPSFWIALLLIQWLAVDHGLLPTGGYVNPSVSLTGWFKTMILPAVSLAIPVAAQLTRIIRASLVEELDRDYVRTARGGGLPPLLVVGRNVLRNALINPLTVLGLRIGYLLAGAVVIETVFGLPGMGQHLIQAVQNGDTAEVQGFVITIALCFVVVNLIVDVLYLVANPRLRSRS